MYPQENTTDRCQANMALKAVYTVSYTVSLSPISQLAFEKTRSGFSFENMKTGYKAGWI